MYHLHRIFYVYLYLSEKIDFERNQSSSISFYKFLMYIARVSRYIYYMLKSGMEIEKEEEEEKRKRRRRRSKRRGMCRDK